MSLLQSIRSGRRAGPRRILLYGGPGVGKGTWASMSDRPIFISTEDGLDDIDCHSFPPCHSYSDVLACLTELGTQPHDFRTVVIDTVDWLERMIWADVCETKGVVNMADIGYGKGYDFAMTQWAEFISYLKALQADQSLNMILLAHCKIEKFNDPQNASYDRYMPKLHSGNHQQGISHVLQEWASEVLFANYKVYTTTTDEGFGRKSVKGTGGGDRVLYTTNKPAHVAKNRLNLPDEMPLDYREFAKYLAPAVAA